MRGWLTIRRTFRAFCAEQGKTALLAQWDIERNLPLTPDDVTFGVLLMADSGKDRRG